MMRLPDWPERLAEFIESRRKAAFSYGTNDCALFFADAVLAMTGEDIAAKYRGYHDVRGATRRIRKAGSLAALCPLPRIEPGLAGRGDGLLIQIQGRDAIALVSVGALCAPGPEELTFLPLDPSRASLAFRV